MSSDLINYTQRETIETLKATVAKGATDAQLAQFIEVCKATGLNPFLREIWCIPATNTIMSSRDGYLTIANNNPQFDGMETTVERDDKGLPIKAVCTVWRKDRSHPVKCEAYYNEYVKPSQVWKQYPSAMISKVAEALTLKRSFAINGLLTQEEISEEMQPSIPVSIPAMFQVIDDPGEKQMNHQELSAMTEQVALLEQLKVAVKKIADIRSVSLDEACVSLFNDPTGKMTYDKISQLKTDKQLEKAKQVLIRTTAILIGKE